MLNGTRESSRAQSQPAKTKRKFSAATLKHMREGQQRRWAKADGETAAPKTAKPKRKLSAAGRKAIVDALKKRWAAKKAAKA